jgi:hypothetical protein
MKNSNSNIVMFDLESMGSGGIYRVIMQRKHCGPIMNMGLYCCSI